MKSLRFRAMNTDILLAAEGPTDQLDAGLERAEKFVHESEARFSRFLPTSELSELNRSAGTWFEASPEMFALIALARRFFHITRGLFDPSILRDLQRAGYNRSLELVQKDGAGPLLESLLASERPSFSELDLDETQRMIRLPKDMGVDLGGIAKGWIAEQAALLMTDFASTCAVNAGGDMFLIGLPEGQSQWPVELEDPFQPEATLARLRVDPGAVATSTVTKRVWKQGAEERHHLIDPRTGEPAVTEWVSVTVMAVHAYEAEVFAKALLISGPSESEDIVRNSGIPFNYVAVDREKKMWGSQKTLEAAHVD